MGIFGKRKANQAAEQVKAAADLQRPLNEGDGRQPEPGSVKVLGSGCAKCNELEASTRQALERLGMDPTIDHVTDFAKIAAYGVMSTPALVVDGKVVSYGKVLKTEEVVTLLKKARGL